MNKERILTLAKKFLQSRDLEFLEPGEFGCLDGHKQEVIFLHPLTLDPKVALVIPEDVRVWVNKKTKEVTLIFQM
ncbi:MAG: hypothetical protein HON43_00420 [Alphaproteobacteria bacterium]|jgi:hypothetical protein|nr:hypothetical protein [Alphaproteobacteria bacterium]MBT5389476.1 hypothetical protein [Alphaproteobacteria bacterium]MBT5541192.1 hypothetical protein [Alphaproteobacteria bacterium]